MTAFALKLIAYLAMLFDHTAFIFSRQVTSVSPWLYVAFRTAGRLAFPLFAFLAAEGAVRTKSPSKYLLRLLIFALVSQIPFSIMAGLVDPDFSFMLLGKTVRVSTQLSVMATLFLGISICLSLREKKHFGAALALVIAFIVEKTVGMDYGVMGVVFIAALYLAREKKWQKLLVMLAFAVLFNAVSLKTLGLALLGSGSLSGIKASSYVMYFSAFAFAAVLALFYNGRQGKKLGIWGYLIYPVHISILLAIRFFV